MPASLYLFLRANSYLSFLSLWHYSRRPLTLLSTTLAVTQQIPLLSLLIYSCLAVPWKNSLWLALRWIAVFSLSSRKGTGTEWCGRKEKGGDVPFCRQGGHCDIMRFAHCFTPSLDRYFLKIHKSSPAGFSSCTLLGLFQAATTASSQKRYRWL